MPHAVVAVVRGAVAAAVVADHDEMEAVAVAVREAAEEPAVGVPLADHVHHIIRRRAVAAIAVHAVVAIAVHVLAHIHTLRIRAVRHVAVHAAHQALAVPVPLALAHVHHQFPEGVDLPVFSTAVA